MTIINQKTVCNGLFVGLFSSTALYLMAPVAAAQDAEDAADRLKLGTVTVTARKKEESLQDAPVAVTAFSGEDLETRGAVDVSDATSSVPNVTFESAGTTSGLSAAPVVFVRGLGQSDFVINADPAVGTYVDGVYVGRSIGSLADLLDLERAEVLRGPQGTLFGRNTIGGAVNLISRAPSTDALEGKLMLGVGEEGYLHASGTANIPLGDALAARVSGFARKRDGYVDALQYDDFQLGEEDVWGIRGALKFDAAENFTVEFAADYSERADSPAAVVPRLIGNASVGGDLIDASGAPVASRFNLGIPPAPPVPAGFGSIDTATCSTAAGRNSSPDCFGNFWLGNGFQTNAVYTDEQGNIIEPEQSLEVYGANLTLTWNTPIGDIKSITAARGFDSTFFNDLDYSPFILFHNINSEFSQDQLSQEFQLTGDAFDGKIDYVAGLYYFEEDGIEVLSLVAPLLPPAAVQTTLPLFQVTDRVIKNDSIAAYGQVTFHATDRLHITGGLRYTEETKEISFEQRRSVGALQTNAQGDLTIDDLTPMINVSYDVTDDIMTYGTYSEGFRSGGFASRFPNGLISPLPSFDPEFVKSYELGVKSNLFDNRVRANIAAFLTDYSDLQVSATSAALAGSPATTNLADATLQGLEVEVNALLTENLRADFSLGLLDAEIDSVIGGVLTAGAGGQIFQITTDNTLPYTPEVNLNIGLTHTLELPYGDVRTRVDWDYTSEYQMTLENHPLTHQDDFSKVNGNITFMPNDSNFDFTLGVRNLTDEEYSTAAALNTTAATVGTNVARPREIYVQAIYRFGQ